MCVKTKDGHARWVVSEACSVEDAENLVQGRKQAGERELGRRAG
jgi:hypothetical protein